MRRGAMRSLWELGRLACGVALVAVLSAADAPPRRERLDRANLLVYRDNEGRIQPVRTIADWQKRRAMILEGMQQVMGPLPGPEKRCPLDVKIEEEVDGGTFVRRRGTYASEPGGRV